MFCPNCGMDCGSENLCVGCGTDLKAIKQMEAASFDEILQKIEQEEPQRTVQKQARSERDKIIDEFDLHFLYDGQGSAEKKKKTAQETGIPVCCPRCRSARYHTEYESTSVRRMRLNRNAYTRLLNIILTIFEIKYRKTVKTCLKCGFVWRD